MISLIWAMDRNGLIGYDNKLPWHMPNDLKRFKERTLGHTVVMGRKTFQSIGIPLKDRNNIVLSKNIEFKAPGCRVIGGVEAVLALSLEEEVFIIGGAKAYQAFLPYAQQMYVTVMDADFHGDTFFPSVTWEEWMLTSTQKGTQDENNPYPHYFMIYERGDQYL